MDSWRTFVGALIVLVMACIAYMSGSKMVIDWYMKRRIKRELKKKRGEK